MTVAEKSIRLIFIGESGWVAFSWPNCVRYVHPDIYGKVGPIRDGLMKEPILRGGNR